MVYVEDGPYYENVVIDKDVTFVLGADSGAEEVWEPGPVILFGP